MKKYVEPVLLVVVPLVIFVVGFFVDEISGIERVAGQAMCVVVAGLSGSLIVSARGRARLNRQRSPERSMSTDEQWGLFFYVTIIAIGVALFSGPTFHWWVKVTIAMPLTALVAATVQALYLRHRRSRTREPDQA